MSDANLGNSAESGSHALHPPALTWEEYESYLAGAWSNLLNSDQQNKEAVFQTFLERHPCLLPETYACFQRGAHTPIFSAVFSQPELPGFRAKRPDFMWLARDSGAIFVVLIEIEAPSKKWSNQQGRPSGALVQAIDQLNSWRAWFKNHSNVAVFRELYEIHPDMLPQQFEQRYILIYGRRQELESNRVFAEKRVGLQRHDEVFMTYDRLRPSAELRHYGTIRYDRSAVNTEIQLIQVPPTFRLGMPLARDFFRFTGREQAIRACREMPKNRQDYLISRIQYWDTFVKEEAARPRIMRPIKPSEWD